MKRLIIFLTVLSVCVFSIYPPFESKAKRPEQIESIQVNETVIKNVEKRNDDQVNKLLENLQVIDSLNRL